MKKNPPSGHKCVFLGVPPVDWSRKKDTISLFSPLLLSVNFLCARRNLDRKKTGLPAWPVTSGGLWKPILVQHSAHTENRHLVTSSEMKRGHVFWFKRGASCKRRFYESKRSVSRAHITYLSRMFKQTQQWATARCGDGTSLARRVHKNHQQFNKHHVY